MKWYPIGYHLRMETLDQTYQSRATGTLRTSRLASGLSLRELARRAGTSHATLLAYENGKKIPSVTTFLRIIEACGFGVDVVTTPRVRYRDGIDRGEELLSVLELAGQFPSRQSRHMEYPKFPSHG